MKNILVTGSSGTIGTRLCERLLGEGYEVIGVDKSPNGWSRKIDALTVRGDLCCSATFGELPSSFDLVIHLAANARVHNLVIEPTLAFENLHSTFGILEFCREKAISRLIFASSREVYGNAQNVKKGEEKIDVSLCESPYTASKIGGEALVKAYERCYGVRCIIARFSNVYGMYDASDRVIPLFIRRAQRNLDLVVYGQNKILDFTYIDDTVSGICRCIQRFESVAGMTFNIASGRGSYVTDIAELIKKTMRSESEIVLGDNRTGEVVQFVADISAAWTHLDYKPQIDVREGLAEAVAWYSRCQDPTWVAGYSTAHK